MFLILACYGYCADEYCQCAVDFYNHKRDFPKPEPPRCTKALAAFPVTVTVTVTDSAPSEKQGFSDEVSTPDSSLRERDRSKA